MNYLFRLLQYINNPSYSWHYVNMADDSVSDLYVYLCLTVFRIAITRRSKNKYIMFCNLYLLNFFEIPKWIEYQNFGVCEIIDLWWYCFKSLHNSWWNGKENRRRMLLIGVLSFAHKRFSVNHRKRWWYVFTYKVMSLTIWFCFWFLQAKYLLLGHNLLVISQIICTSSKTV